jgi:hypothetical protein
MHVVYANLCRAPDVDCVACSQYIDSLTGNQDDISKLDGSGAGDFDRSASYIDGGGVAGDDGVLSIEYRTARVAAREQYDVHVSRINQ